VGIEATLSQVEGVPRLGGRAAWGQADDGDGDDNNSYGVKHGCGVGKRQIEKKNRSVEGVLCIAWGEKV
jgi:hypothetical protein